MATTRRALAAGAALVAILVGVLVWKLGEKPEPARQAPAVATTSPSPAAFPPAGPAPTLGDTGSAAVPPPQPKPLAPGEAPPALDAPVSKPAPPQKAFTREETIANREADLKLLDDTKTRLEGQLATAKANKDATATHDLEVRLTRLADLRKKREDELEKIRAGGPLPP
jgi:hypothetical protein